MKFKIIFLPLEAVCWCFFLSILLFLPKECNLEVAKGQYFLQSSMRWKPQIIPCWSFCTQITCQQVFVPNPLAESRINDNIELGPLADVAICYNPSYDYELNPSANNANELGPPKPKKLWCDSSCSFSKGEHKQYQHIWIRRFEAKWYSN